MKLLSTPFVCFYSFQIIILLTTSIDLQSAQRRGQCCVSNSEAEIFNLFTNKYFFQPRRCRTFRRCKHAPAWDFVLYLIEKLEEYKDKPLRVYLLRYLTEVKHVRADIFK